LACFDGDGNVPFPSGRTRAGMGATKTNCAMGYKRLPDYWAGDFHTRVIQK